MRLFSSLPVLVLGGALVVASLFGQTRFVNGPSTFEGPINYCGSDTGTVNAYACANTSGATVQALHTGAFYIVTLANTNTGASTLSVDGHSATIKKQQGSVDVAAGDLVAGAAITVVYDGANFQLLTPPAGLSSGAYAAGTDIQSPYLSDNALFSWHVGLHYAPSQVVNLVVVGDSIACCVGTTSYWNIWTQRLRSNLALYASAPSHGTGLIPIGNNGGAALLYGWTQSGTWTQGTDFGPHQSGTGSFSTMWIGTGTGSSMTYNPSPQMQFDSLRVYGETTTDSAGCNVSIDGGAATTIFNTTGSATFTTATVASTLGSHSVVISPSTAGKCYIYGIEGTIGTTGLSIHNLAHGYARSEAFGTTTSTELTPMLANISGGVQAAIVSLGVNDSINGTGVTASQYQTNLTNILNALRSNNSRMSILIVDENNTSAGTSASPLNQSQTRAIELALAYQYGAAYLSVADRWGSYSNANAAGLMNADGVHPKDIGAADIEGLVEQRLVDALH